MNQYIRLHLKNNHFPIASDPGPSQAPPLATVPQPTNRKSFPGEPGQDPGRPAAGAAVDQRPGAGAGRQVPGAAPEGAQGHPAAPLVPQAVPRRQPHRHQQHADHNNHQFRQRRRGRVLKAGLVVFFFIIGRMGGAFEFCGGNFENTSGIKEFS